MKGFAVIALAGALVASGCVPVGGATQTPGPLPSASRFDASSAPPTSSADGGSPSANVTRTPSPSEVAAAQAAVDAYTKQLVAGDWAGAYTALAPGYRTQWTSLADFASERGAFFKSVGDRFSVRLADAASEPPIGDWEPELHGTRLDIAHAVLVEVDYPELDMNNAGFNLYVVQPGALGLDIFQVR